ncbi:hypothetical protein N7493_002591 [Penicillium malachiteum]|uniref:Uncharacterized protein n=1 Tax=Penicillium malachiteum TaxID=1324776 RepID=A0AAD6HSH6_9EURO|nr:hypothetical protein N7493_002591 [Penicillium malachiteum]
MAPKVDPADDNPLRVVFLADFLPADQAKLIDRIQTLAGPSRRLESWKPGSQTLRTPLKKFTDYHWHDFPDTKAHIYEVATRLHRAGCRKFLVADRLTWRQLTQNFRLGDYPLLSVVLVVIKSSPSGKHSSGTSPFLIFAERRTIDKNAATAVHQEPFFFMEDKTIHPSLAIDEPSIHAQSLLDGDEEIFTPTDLRLTVREQFEKEIHSALPGSLLAELKSYIISYLDHRMPYHGSSLRDENNNLTFEPDKEPITIFLTFPTSPAQFARLNSVMSQQMKKIFEKIISSQPSFSRERQDAKESIQGLIRRSDSSYYGNFEDSDNVPELPLDRFSVQLIQWPYEQPAKRRNIVHHFLELHYQASWHYLFKCPFSSSDETLLDNAQFATLAKLANDNPWPTASISAAHNTFTGIVRDQLKLALDSRLLSSLKPKKPSNYQISHETLSDPDQGFYHNAPPWEPVQDFEVEEWDPRYGPHTLPIFYLTNKFTEEQAESLECAVGHEGEILRVPCMTGSTIPSTGTLHDMWNIFWQIQQIWQTESPREDIPLFFADEQSFIDETLIVVDRWHLKEMNLYHHWDSMKRVDKPHMRGMVYGRIIAFNAIMTRGALAYGERPRVDKFRKEIESHDQVDVVHRYLRPDWPGHGIIPDDER